jgi:Ni/Co efflux regulator RcnB
MRKILLLSAALSLALAAPALAQGQNPGTFHWHDSRQQNAPQNRPAAPAAQNQAQNRDQNRGASRHDSRSDSNRGPAMRRDNRADNNRHDSNRGRSDRHDNDRGRYDRHDNNRGPYDRRDNNRGNIGRGQHHDWRAYHRSHRASRRFHAPRYHRPSGWYARRWTFGEFLPSLFWAPQYWLNNYFAYDLPPPPAGTVWVRNGDDAILIDRYTGEIVMVEYDVFY